jgi:hypothetical protein
LFACDFAQDLIHDGENAWLKHGGRGWKEGHSHDFDNDYASGYVHRIPFRGSIRRI